MIKAIVFHLAFTCSKSAKDNTRTMCQIYSTLTIQTPEQCLVLLFLILNMYLTLPCCYYFWIWTTLCRLSLRKYRQFFSATAGNILSSGKICWAKWFYPYSPNISWQKDKVSWQYFQKISPTLIRKRQGLYHFKIYCKMII